MVSARAFILAAASALAVSAQNVTIPPGYALVFGPVAGANNAPGYAGSVGFATYDTLGCATACNNMLPDATNQTCRYFNLWTGNRTFAPPLGITHTCALYFTPTNATTATNTGDINVSVSNSRGFRRL